MIPGHWYKKDVSLTLRGKRLAFSTAQELFSSHEVDAGSRALLKAIDFDALPAEGHIIDYGCGYGVLGLAARRLLPAWTLDLIDRDALAVTFAVANAHRLDLEAGTRTIPGLGPDTGLLADLFLWNVPGKIGHAQQERLASDAVNATNAGGVLGLVVVKPILDHIRPHLDVDGVVRIEHTEFTSDHAILIARKIGAASSPGDPFARGVFDRDPWGFGVDDVEYDIIPVVGLPDYDEYGFDTQLAFDLMRAFDGEATSVLMMAPGQGHLPIVASARFDPESLILVDRDVLALEASHRALIGAGRWQGRLVTVANADLVLPPDSTPPDFAILMLEDQIRNEIHQSRLSALEEVLAPGGQVIVAGRSTEVSRFTTLANKTGRWKARAREKRGGCAAVRLQLKGARD